MTKVSKLVSGAIGFAAAGPALFSSFGWTAIIICVAAVVAFTIKIVKELKKK